jgi:heme/copper-type cytochrome/quinol oxidase subunit 4
MISAGIDRSLGTLLVIMFLGSFVIDTVVGSNPATPNFAFVSIYSLWDKLWLALDPVRPPLVTVCLASLIITVTCLPDIARNDRRHGSVGSAWVGILVAALAFTWLQKLLQLQYFVFLSSKAVFPLQIASWVLVAAVVTSSIWLIYTSWSEPST